MKFRRQRADPTRRNPRSSSLRDSGASRTESRDTSREFQLQEFAFVELDDLLKLTGLCGTGGMAKTAIADGRVKIDGTVELRRRCKIRAGQTVEFGGHTISVR
jgi:ribosome-associated protein